MYIVEVDNFEKWRRKARELLKRGIPPDFVTWSADGQQSLEFIADDDFFEKPVVNTNITVPKQFVELAERAACYRDNSRWALLYRLLWRLVHENKQLLSMPIDNDVNLLLKMCKSVNRDKHKMEAFLRFKKISMSDEKIDADMFSQNEYFMAWYEPDHLVLPITAKFFSKRFANMNWSILTPDLCVHWNQKDLQFTEGQGKALYLDDDMESLWLTYYSHIFNPARLKLKAMQSEMPKKFWKNLPEAALIKDLTRESTRRLELMSEKVQEKEWSKTSQSRYIKELQNKLRNRAKGIGNH